MNLNKNQRLAVENNDKFLCVIAGPGTGKTLTITAKIIHLLRQGVSPEEISALTFTQKAAIEMRDRVIRHIDKKDDLPFIGTFHLLCLKLLRNFLPEGQRNFQICTRPKQREIIKSFGEKNPDTLIDKISKIKNQIALSDDKAYSVYERYENLKANLNLLDFDDLLIKIFQMLEKGDIPPLFTHIIVDEFQDINKLQYEITKRLLKNDGYLSVFGDPDQAIYSFRGSEVELFLNLPKDFHNLNLLNLSINYRSQANIIHASNKFITTNTKRFSKKIEPVKPPTYPITLIEVEDEHEEAWRIVNEIKKRLGATDFSELYKNKEETIYSYSSFAVLTRTNKQMRLIREHLVNDGIPVKSIKLDADDWIDSFIKNFTEIIAEPQNSRRLRESLPLIDFLTCSGVFQNLSEYEAFLIRNIAKNYKKGTLIEQIRAFLDELSGLTSFDLFPEKLNAVSLLTMHSSKGLEFPIVIIAGFDEGIIPYSLSSNMDLEEERRLFYVAMTRAIDELILIHANNRFINGRKLSLRVSPFLKEIPEDYIAKEEVRQRKGRPLQKGLF